MTDVEHGRALRSVSNTSMVTTRVPGPTHIRVIGLEAKEFSLVLAEDSRKEEKNGSLLQREREALRWTPDLCGTGQRAMSPSKLLVSKSSVDHSGWRRVYKRCDALVDSRGHCV